MPYFSLMQLDKAQGDTLLFFSALMYTQSLVCSFKYLLKKKKTHTFVSSPIRDSDKFISFLIDEVCANIILFYHCSLFSLPS